jgi:FlaA1/EpsC-like NDP-sugar epimerase
MFRKQQLHRAVKLCLDLLVLGAAYCLGFGIRFEGVVRSPDLETLRRSLPYVLLVQCTALIAFRLPSRSWRQVSLLDAKYLGAALAASSWALLLIRLVADGPGRPLAVTGLGNVPLGVLLADLCLGFLGTVALRAWFRHWGERFARRRRGQEPRQVRTLLLGAGRAGAQVVEELSVRPDLGVAPVGFLDDDPGQLGKIVHGVRVLGTTADFARAVADCRAEQVLITGGGLSGARLRRLLKVCDQCGVSAKIIPGVPDVVAGKVNVSAMRDVALEDLLHREPVHLDTPAIAACVRSRRVLVTGAGGSIGSELCRVVCRFGPAALVLVEQAENSLFHVHRELARAFPDVEVVPSVADVCDAARVREIFARWQPHLVLHAAAHKHVPLMESNPGEAVKNNVLGTRCLADCADAAGVRAFVLISTDKAVNPTSVMGVSKRVAEIYLQVRSQHSKTRFLTVRFGNVLGSNGSVIPIFKEQLARGGPLTVTHPDMKRFFMTIPEACQLVLQAAAMGRGGELFLLDMGEQVRILDLAHDMIRLSGLAPDDVGIEFVGLRPGEKLSEELSFKDEQIERTIHPRIFVGHLAPQDWAEVNRQVEELGSLAGRGDAATVRAFLRTIVPEYQPDPAAGAEDGLGWRGEPGHALPNPHTNGVAHHRNGTGPAAAVPAAIRDRS